MPALPTITINGKTFHVDGDVLLHPSQLAGWAATVVPDRARPEELIAMTLGGKVARWRPDRTLTFAVERATFPDALSYATAVASIESAAVAWEATCGVRFDHQVAHDHSADAVDKVVFTVRHQALPSAQVALAFFPGDAAIGRHVLIDPKWFTIAGVDREGIIRHELGHVLGFRHEHIRYAAAAAALGYEAATNTYDLTSYDGQSVMHYVNQTYGNPKLDISELDRLGAQRVYGLPFAQTAYVD